METTVGESWCDDGFACDHKVLVSFFFQLHKTFRETVGSLY
jgi:hypothetical protein